jgi:hypothetical protein
LSHVLAQQGFHVEAEELAGMIEPEEKVKARTPERTDEQVAIALAEEGRHEEARAVISRIRSDVDRGAALSALADSLGRAGRWDEARAIAYEAGDFWRGYILRDLADALIEERRVGDAFSMLGSRSLDESLQALAQWATHFEKLRSGLSVAVLREATAVAGWARPDWEEISQLLPKEN